MKILIDLQGCQTESRHRGIGRYSLSLAKAIVMNKGSHQIVLLANGAFNSELEQLKYEFLDFVDDRDFIVFPVPFSVAEHNSAHYLNCRHAELIRERIIAEIAPDVVLLTSLFEGFLDDAVTSIGTIGKKPLTGAVLYDLIPFLRKDPAWPEEYIKHYAEKIESLKRSDFLLSISNYARQEASEAIPELTDRIFNISSACNDIFCPGEVSTSRREELFDRYGIKGKFLMSAGNLEPRKNFETILQAFSTLPAELRKQRQVVIVGSANDERVVKNLHQILVKSGMSRDDLIITGHVPDRDLLDLYRLSEIFIFASLHEGFGLPPLEAMTCGTATLGSCATSIPEVIGDIEAMFTPDSIDELRDKLQRALTDSTFYQKLKSNAAIQSTQFSWEKTAIAAITEMERCHLSIKNTPSKKSFQIKKPALAMVSPLPPEQTGIADYLADLLPEFIKYYNVTIISDQKEVAPGPSGEIFDVRTIEWFETHADAFDRIVYQMGNSPFHAHMPDLIHRHPGVVVLHDFYLSALAAWLDVAGYEKNGFHRNLQNSHGYLALSHLDTKGAEAAKLKWPCSFEVVNAALGLIIHSIHASDLICQYYGNQFIRKSTIVKQHRLIPCKQNSRSLARNRLNIDEDCFLVCAFGFMDKTKLNHQLLDAWATSALSQNKQCRLVFVGGQAPGEYGDLLDSRIAGINNGKHISITGFAPKKMFEDYLVAADVAVQLRTLSRGETSRTVLDCLAYGLPVIVNSHGSMAEYPDDIIFKLDDKFKNSDLTTLLEYLHSNPDKLKDRAKKGIEYIRTMHSPEQTVNAYIEAIEQVSKRKEKQLIKAASHNLWSSCSIIDRHDRALFEQNTTTLLHDEHRPILYIDISATARNDLRTGIERVARALLQELLISPPNGYLVKPVYLDEIKGQWIYKLANKFLSHQPGYTFIEEEDLPVTPRSGDILMALDLFSEGVIPAETQGLYKLWQSVGAEIGFMIYDILPITHPHCFPSWSKEMHSEWLKSVINASDFLISISKHVRSEVKKWIDLQMPWLTHQPRLEYSYLGADVEASFPTVGFPENANAVLTMMDNTSNFLMVGTIEPRKCHLEVISTFEKLWAQGIKANLIIIGHEGWKSLPDEERRTIPQTISAIKNSQYFGNQLIWLEGISDEYLREIYKRSSTLIAASEDEGFGLPLIEAFREGLFVLARDIPVFREIGGDIVEYFSSKTGDLLEDHIKKIIKDRVIVKNFNTQNWLSWAESAQTLKKSIFKNLSNTISVSS